MAIISLRSRAIAADLPAKFLGTGFDVAQMCEGEFPDGLVRT
ncbi:hypothetical protein [Nitrobacter sp. TKz-YC02]